VPAKTYTLLSSIPTGNKPGQTPIKQCSAILDNHMQCWNASAFVVKTTDKDDNSSEYQLCRRHAMIEQAMAPAATDTLKTTSDLTEVKTAESGAKTEAKPATKVITESTSTFKPAPAKPAAEPMDIVAEIDRKVSEDPDPTPAAKPLLSPKIPKPAAF
jgi:hypothetical protein